MSINPSRTSFRWLSMCLQVREALHDVPEKVEEFVSLLNEFERVTGGQDMVTMFRKLRCILGNRTDLLRDFAAFLYPDQALECGLVRKQVEYRVKLLPVRCEGDLRSMVMVTPDLLL